MILRRMILRPAAPRRQDHLAQAFLLKAPDDLADEAPLDAIRFENDQGLLHKRLVFCFRRTSVCGILRTGKRSPSPRMAVRGKERTCDSGFASSPAGPWWTWAFR